MGGYSGGFSKKLPEVSLMSKRETGSKMDLLQAKTKPISNGGSASVIMCQRTGGKNQTATAAEESSESR